jgi:hypothetical protein
MPDPAIHLDPPPAGGGLRAYLVLRLAQWFHDDGPCVGVSFDPPAVVACLGE